LLLGGVAAGTGAFVWAKGELRKVYDSGYEETRQAVRGALSEMGLQASEAEPTGSHAEWAALLEDGTEVKVEAEALTKETTRVGIRVGITGDRQLSDLFHDKVRRRLKPKGNVK
jgi:hypothetical protein